MGSSAPIAGQYPFGRGNPLTSLKVVEVGQRRQVAQLSSIAFSIIRLHSLQVEQLPWRKACRALQQLKNRVIKGF